MTFLAPLNDAQWTARSVSYTGTAGNTATWPAGPQGVLVTVTTDAYVRVGDGVTATTADSLIPAWTPVLMKVPPGGVPWRVSAIQLASGGTVYAKPLNAE